MKSPGVMEYIPIFLLINTHNVDRKKELPKCSGWGFPEMGDL